MCAYVSVYVYMCGCVYVYLCTCTPGIDNCVFMQVYSLIVCFVLCICFVCFVCCHTFVLFVSYIQCQYHYVL